MTACTRPRHAQARQTLDGQGLLHESCALSVELTCSEPSRSLLLCHVAELLFHGAIIDLPWECLLKIDIYPWPLHLDVLM